MYKITTEVQDHKNINKSEFRRIGLTSSDDRLPPIRVHVIRTKVNHKRHQILLSVDYITAAGETPQAVFRLDGNWY